jgi:aspartate aminotransferase
MDVTNKVYVNQMAYGLRMSPILEFAYEVKQLKAEGKPIANYTVGDFNTGDFAIPAELTERIIHYYREGQTNYPPAMGMHELRKAVCEVYAGELGAYYEPNEIVVAAGARPLIYGIFRTIVDAGDRVLYGAPSWNNRLYCHLNTAVPEALRTTPSDSFLITVEDLGPQLEDATLLSLNSPSNPSGTMFSHEQLSAVCKKVLEVNERRVRRGAKPLYIMYDHIYRELNFDMPHYHPVALYPELKDFVIYVDGISKAYAATGVRVGWSAGPAHVMEKMSSVLSHVGAWAPKPEQLATADFLRMRDARDRYLTALKTKISGRLNKLYAAFRKWEDEGLAATALTPEGGIYLSAYFGLLGKRMPEGTVNRTSQELARYLVHHANTAAIPFEGFDDTRNPGWFRMSVGGVTDVEIDASIRQLEELLRKTHNLG